MNKATLWAIGLILACGFGGYYVAQSSSVGVIKPGKEKVISKQMTPEEKKNQVFLLEMAQLNLYKATLKHKHPGVAAIAATIPFSYQLLSYMVETAATEQWENNTDYLRERFIATVQVAFSHGTNDTKNRTPLTDEELLTIAEIAIILYKENPRGLFNIPYTEFSETLS